MNQFSLLITYEFLVVWISETKLDWTSNLQMFTSLESWLQASNNTGTLSSYTRLWLTESEQVTPVD